MKVPCSDWEISCNLMEKKKRTDSWNI